MGKKNKQALGKSIIKHRARSGGNTNNWLHSSELVDDVAPNLQSITEQSTLDDFLATAELAGTQFAAEKLNATIVTPRQNEGLLTKETADAIKQAQQENEHFLGIPRRPDWDKNMTPEELDEKERNAFLQWRRQLAKLQENEHILLTPFERNLVFWRQLWRVIERSDVVVQIVDARNPLLYRCEDLENYVIEVDPKKSNLLLINKADFLTADQRDMWARHFHSIGLQVAFWSAHLESERLTAFKSSDKGDSPDENQPEEQSEGESDRALSKFSEMSVEQKGDPEVELECTSVVDEAAGVTEVDLDQNTVHNSGTEDQSVLHPSNKSGTTKECLNQVLLPEKSCKSEAMGLHVSTGLLTRKTSLQQQPNACSNAGQINESDASNDSSDLQRTPSDLCHQETLENSKQFTETLVDLERTHVTEDHLLNTDNKNVDSDFSGNILTKEELLALFKTLHSEKGDEDFVKETPKKLTTVGLVGYPNVGKSSTINALLADKKVPVSATPGRTKHFQTLYVSDEILLCDCPGLVFPSFVSTKADMVLNGILPIDQMRDHVPPVSLVCQRIPRDVLEIVYGINVPPPQEGEDPDRAPYADEVLSAYGYMRGFMTSHGLPDCARSARYILKDYVKGKLLYCIPPPGEDECDFQQIGHKLQKLIDGEGKVKKIHGTSHKQMSDVDQDFFRQEQVRCFSRGFHATGRQFTPGLSTQTTTTGAPMGGEAEEAGVVPYKPWKKHYNRNKREKLRRLAKK